MNIFGILNVTTDSFSDGGKYLAPEAALPHVRRLVKEGADVIDIGAASSNPDAGRVTPEVEIARLASVVPALKAEGLSLSIDSFAAEVQRWALAQGVDYINDIHGFPDPALYPALAASNAKLVVMHAIQATGIATREDVTPDRIMDRITAFFDARLAALEAAGIARACLILDPGMGFFLGTNPETSLTVLEQLPLLKQRYGLPVLVSVSRKSFLRAQVDNDETWLESMAAATEAVAVCQGGADHIRTHAPGPLRMAIKALKDRDKLP
jgi:dihydropteroate synthase type 2